MFRYFVGFLLLVILSGCAGKLKKSEFHNNVIQKLGAKHTVYISQPMIVQNVCREVYSSIQVVGRECFKEELIVRKIEDGRLAVYRENSTMDTDGVWKIDNDSNREYEYSLKDKIIYKEYVITVHEYTGNSVTYSLQLAHID